MSCRSTGGYVAGPAVAIRHENAVVGPLPDDNGMEEEGAEAGADQEADPPRLRRGHGRPRRVRTYAVNELVCTLRKGKREGRRS